MTRARHRAPSQPLELVAALAAGMAAVVLLVPHHPAVHTPAATSPTEGATYPPSHPHAHLRDRTAASRDVAGRLHNDPEETRAQAVDVP